MVFTPVPVDPEDSRAWSEISIGARIDLKALMSVGDPERSSNFAQVNALYPFEKVSDRARAYLMAALEHMVFWADYSSPLKFDPGHSVNFTLRPAYTLARAAMESSAQAVWLMDTRDPPECVRRHLSLIRWDLQEHKRSKLDDEGKKATQRIEDQLLTRVGHVFKPKQISPPTSYGQVIRDACAPTDLDLEAEEAGRLWRAASGAAHGKYWPTVDLQKVHVGEEYEPGHHRTTRIPDSKGMTEVLRAAQKLTQYGVLRYLDYAGVQVGAVMAQATQDVVAQLPVRADLTPAEHEMWRRAREGTDAALRAGDGKRERDAGA